DYHDAHSSYDDIAGIEHAEARFAAHSDVQHCRGIAMSLALLPQVAADTFYDRVLRGVQSSIGSDVQSEVNLTDLAGGRDEAAPAAVYNSLAPADISGIESVLKCKTGVESLVRSEQYIISGIYLPIDTKIHQIE